MQALNFDVPWIEKYRPQILNDVVGNKDIIEQLKSISAQGNIPNMIMSGPPGCGKTTSVMALAHELLGENFSKAAIELNASDDRGIDVVRERIKAFANQKVPLPDGRHKIIILDEADALTTNAQQALRVIISDYAATTRFALACNDSSKLIEAIQSRCCLLRFTKLKQEEIKERIKYVLNAENIQYDEQGLEDIVDTCEGDMRNALNNLQSTAVGFGFVNHENVYNIIDVPKPEVLRQIIEHCRKGELNQAMDKVDGLYGEGYSSMDILTVCNKIIKKEDKVHDTIKFKMIKTVVDYKLKFLDGINSFVQMYGFLSEITELFKEQGHLFDDGSAMDLC
ncbi:MAG: replication factor C small subunit [archaeon]|nr:replication factor C small subunit [archaeon]